MRWVFVHPFSHRPYYDPEVQEPLGIEYLAASRRIKNEPVLLLDGTLNNSMTEYKIGRRIASFYPDVICFSFTTAQELNSFNIIYNECKAFITKKDVKWLAGGNFISTETSHAEKLLPDCFILVKFEGENVLDELSSSWAREEKSKKICNVACNRTNSSRVINGNPVEDLDSLPFPVRSFSKQILKNNGVFNIQASRGCCGNCSFCASPGMASNKSNKWRGRSISHIVDEIEYLYTTYNTSSFNFVDEDFLGPNKLSSSRANELLKELRNHHLKISFSIQVRPDSLSEEIIDYLVEAGLIFVFMGLESDNSLDLKRWKRPIIRNPWKFVKYFRKRNVEVNVGAILFHPHSTFDGIRLFANKLHEYKLLDHRVATNRLAAMPGSKLFRYALKKNAIDRNAIGPQPMPFIDPNLEMFYDSLCQALDPLGPPSMHALCSIPVLLSQSRFRKERRTYYSLKKIINELNEYTINTLLVMIDSQKKNITDIGLVQQLRTRNLEIAINSCEKLFVNGFAHSFDELRNAIKIDSGL